jgi:hypothetical protein
MDNVQICDSYVLQGFALYTKKSLALHTSILKTDAAYSFEKLATPTSTKTVAIQEHNQHQQLTTVKV